MRIMKEEGLSISKISTTIQTAFSLRHKIVLLAFVLSLMMLVVGVIQFEWFIEEISAMFFIMGIAVGIIGGLKSDEIIKGFLDGAKDLVGTAIIVAFARATFGDFKRWTNHRYNLIRSFSVY